MEYARTSSKSNPLQEFTISLANNLDETKTTIDEKKGIATVSGKKNGKFLSFFIEQKDCNDELQSNVNVENSPVRKSDYKEEIKKLHKEGFKQKEIAFRLNMSQSLVSRLLNSD